MKQIIERIGNEEFFFALDNQVRKMMPKYEMGVLLPACKRILNKNRIPRESLLSYPIEGYYYKNELLTEYFTILRNLQCNPSIFKRIEIDDDVLLLKRVTGSVLFGKEDSKEIEESILPRRKDALTLAMKNENFFDEFSPRPWDISKILVAARAEVKDVNGLVDLAAIIGNSKCLLAGAETNAAYREICYVSGCFMGEIVYEWGVSASVEEAADSIISNYEQVTGMEIIKPSVFNISTLNYKMELPRVSWLGTVRATRENYFWIMNSFDNEVRDIYSTDIITTESLLKNRI